MNRFQVLVRSGRKFAIEDVMQAERPRLTPNPRACDADIHTLLMPCTSIIHFQRNPCNMPTESTNQLVSVRCDLDYHSVFANAH